MSSLPRDSYVSWGEPPVPPQPDTPVVDPWTWAERILLCAAWGLRLWTLGLMLLCFLAPLARWSWLGNLGSSLAAFCIIGLVPAVIVYRQQLAVGLVLVAMLTAAWPWMQYHYRSKAVAPSADAPLISVMVANIGWWNTRAPEAIAAALVAANPDILVLPEVPPAVVTRLRAQGDWKIWHTGAVSEGPYSLAIASRLQRAGEASVSVVAGPERHYRSIDDKRFAGTSPIIRMPLRWGSQQVTVYALHPPPPTKPSLFRHQYDIFAYVLAAVEREDGPTLIVGDFNATPAAPVMADLHAKGFRMAPGARHGTWGPDWLGLPLLVIDHVLARGMAMQPAVTAVIPGSDHRAVQVQVALLEP